MSSRTSLVTRSSTGSKLVISVTEGKLEARIDVSKWRTLSEMREMLKMLEDLAKMYHEIPMKIDLQAYGEDSGVESFCTITFDNGTYELTYGVVRELDLPSEIVRKIMPGPNRIRPFFMKQVHGIVEKLERDTGYKILLELNYPLGFKVIVERSVSGLTNFDEIQQKIRYLRKDLLEASKVLVERLRREIVSRLGGAK